MTLDFVQENFIIGQKSPDLSPKFVFYKRGFRLGGSSGSDWKDITIKGIGSLTLVNAKANSLSSLTLFGGTEQRNLPKGYTQLDYIESDGTQYMDIDVSGNVTFIGTAQSTTDSPTTSQVLMANGGASAGRWFGVQSPSAGESYSKRWGLGATPTASSTIYGTTKIDFNLTFSDVDGQYGTINNETLTRTNTMPTQTDWIALAGTESSSYGFIGKVWKLQAVQNNVLVRDFVPCKNSSNIAGMYDLVSGRFFGSSTASNFVAGTTAVPNPDTPMDIISNNGVIKYGKDLTIDGTRNYAYINTTGGWAWSSDSYSIALPVTVGKKYRIIISSTNSSVVGTIFRYGFTDSDPEEFKQSEVTPSPTSISIYDFWRGTPQDLSDVEVTATHPYMIIQFAAAYASTVVSTYLTVIDQSIYTDGTVETVEVTGKNLLDKSKFADNLHWQIITSRNEIAYDSSYNWGVSDWIKVTPGQAYTFSTQQNRSGAALFLTDEYGKKTGLVVSGIVPTTAGSSNTYTIPSGYNYIVVQTAPDYFNVDVQIELGSTATTYEPYYNGGSATAEMLLKVGTYQDVQSVLDGEVTRNIGIKVLDGTEDVGKSGSYAGSFFIRNVVSGWGTTNLTPVFCTHFSNVTTESAYNAQGKCIILNNAFNMWWGSDSTPTAAQFSAWLAEQYANGTPVIVVYQKSSATTETVTGQPLTIQAGTNIVEITQASIDNLGLEVSYKGTVTP